MGLVKNNKAQATHSEHKRGGKSLNDILAIDPMGQNCHLVTVEHHEAIKKHTNRQLVEAGSFQLDRN